QLHVLLGQIASLVEHREAHDVEVQVDVSDLLHLEDPPRGDPGPRTERVEPEVDSCLLGTGVAGHGTPNVNRAIGCVLDRCNARPSPDVPRPYRDRCPGPVRGWIAGEHSIRTLHRPHPSDHPTSPAITPDRQGDPGTDMAAP